MNGRNEAFLKRSTVLVSVGTSYDVGRQIWEGIIEAGQAFGPWQILANFSGPLKPEFLYGTFPYSGMIFQSEPSRDVLDLSELLCPAVILSGGIELSGKIGCVAIDQVETGRLAFEHLHGRGFQHVGLVGVGHNASDERFLGFSLAAMKAGYVTQHVCPSVRLSGHVKLQMNVIHDWLAVLPKPIGIFCVQDQVARLVAETCVMYGYRVPEEVALVGLNNDWLVCSMTEPALSSVDHNARELGYKGGELLARMMQGEAAPSEPVKVMPTHVSERASTNIYVGKDPHYAAALRLIRERACEGLTVSDILETVPVSRRKLEYLFRELLGRTPHQEITRVRVERVKALLLDTDLGLADIAARVGFRYASQLSHVFKREMGCSPRKYRVSRGGEF